jgi:hypothetical protein
MGTKHVICGATGVVGSRCTKSLRFWSDEKGISSEVRNRPKVKVALHQDFGTNHHLCWISSGGRGLQVVRRQPSDRITSRRQDRDFPDLVITKPVGIDYILEAARAFATSLATKLE